MVNLLMKIIWQSFYSIGFSSSGCDFEQKKNRTKREAVIKETAKKRHLIIGGHNES